MAKNRKRIPEYSGAARRFAQRKRQMKAGVDAGTTRSKPATIPILENPGFSTMVSEPDLRKLVKRVALNAVNAPLVVRPGVNLVVQDLPDSTALAPPYGILPFITSASPEELLAAADKFAAAKYEFARRGMYYESWQAGWRERLIERVLIGATRIGIVPA